MPHSLPPNQNQDWQPKQIPKKQHLPLWSLSRSRALRLEEVLRLPTPSRVLVRRLSALPASCRVSRGLSTTFNAYRHLTLLLCLSVIDRLAIPGCGSFESRSGRLSQTTNLERPRKVSVPGYVAESCMELAAAAGSVKGLVQQLEAVFPSAIGSAKRAKPLKDLYAAIFPDMDPTQASSLPQKSAPSP